MFIGSLLTTSPTATSSLLLGSATYAFLWGTRAGVESLGARENVPLEDVDRAGDSLRLDPLDWGMGGRDRSPDARRGVCCGAVRLVVRWRDAAVPCIKVLPLPFGPENERAGEKVDIWLDGRGLPEMARREGFGGTSLDVEGLLFVADRLEYTLGLALLGG